MRTLLKTRRPWAAAILTILTWVSASVAHAQTTQVPIPEEPAIQPQLEIDGTGLVTLQVGQTQPRTGGHTGNNGVDFSDSSLTFGAAQRLFRRDGVGSMVFGFLTPSSGERDLGSKTDLFVHQAFADFQSQKMESYIGRTNQPSAQIVEFPTIREEDLITFTHLLNPFSNGQNSEEHRYGNVASVTLNQNLTYFENFHVQHLLNTDTLAGGSGINSSGATFQYLGKPGLEAVERILNYGVGFEHRSVPDSLGGASDALFGGGVVNIRRSLLRRIDFRVLGTATFGNDTRTLATPVDAFRADSRSIGASLRYLRTPFGMPSGQIALTAGYRTYPKISAAKSYGMALTGVKRLGQGFDLVAQYSYEHRGGELATAFGGHTEQAVQLGFVMNFNSTFNKHISPRRTLLNLRHSYMPQ